MLINQSNFYFGYLVHNYKMWNYQRSVNTLVTEVHKKRENNHRISIVLWWRFEDPNAIKTTQGITSSSLTLILCKKEKADFLMYSPKDGTPLLTNMALALQWIELWILSIIFLFTVVKKVFLQSRSWGC